MVANYFSIENILVILVVASKNVCAIRIFIVFLNELSVSGDKLSCYLLGADNSLRNLSAHYFTFGRCNVVG